VGHGRARPFVDLDRADLVELHARFRQAKPLRVRPASGRVHHQIGREFGAGERTDVEAGLHLVDPRDLGPQMDLDAAIAHFLCDGEAHIVVEPGEQGVTAAQQRHFGAEAAEDAGEFDGDIAAADDHDMARQTAQFQRVVRGNDMVDAMHRRQHRMPAGRNEDVGGRVALAVDLDRVRVHQPPAPFEELHLGIAEELAINAFESLDLLVLGVNEGRPVMYRGRDMPAEARRVGEGIGELRAIDQQLLRHAAADDAGAADPAVLANSDACAVAPGPSRCGNAARPGADGEKVEIVGRHGCINPSRRDVARTAAHCHSAGRPPPSIACCAGLLLVACHLFERGHMKSAGGSPAGHTAKAVGRGQ
jgi:hypothetical protein